MDADGSCILLEITQYALQITVLVAMFSTHGSWFFFVTPLRPGDGFVCCGARKTHLTKHIIIILFVLKPLAICHFDHFGSCSCVSNLIQGFRSAKKEQRRLLSSNSSPKDKDIINVDLQCSLICGIIEITLLIVIYL